MRREYGLAAVMAGGLLSCSIVAAAARTVWDGVYTEVQATRGALVYSDTCALCHGLNLDGTENGPELLGDVFLKPWYGKSVQDLVVQTQRAMPKDDPGILTRQRTVDVLAYIFRANKFPMGPADLATTPEALSDIRIEPKRP